MQIVLVSVALLLLSYFFMLIQFIRGWRKAIRINATVGQIQQQISVVIPVRDEATVLPALLQQLRQIHDADFEVIIVDDHSTDGTVDAAREVIGDDLRFVVVTNSGEGKKKAITTGVNHAKGNVIVTTDGDCEIQRSWLNAINEHFQDAETKMVFGAVSIQVRSWLDTLQAIEFSSLIGSGAATWGLGIPVMCNGANLAFRKEVFREVGGYRGNETIASGDDEFLMRKVLARYPDGLKFLSSSAGTVITRPAKSWSAFFMQRLRWAGKWRFNSSIGARVLAVYILLLQLAIIGCLIFLFGTQGERAMAVSLLMMRLFLESLFLIPVCRFLNVRWSWTAYIVLQVVYPFYVVVTGLFSNLTPITWKKRKI